MLLKENAMTRIGNDSGIDLACMMRARRGPGRADRCRSSDRLRDQGWGASRHRRARSVQARADGADPDSRCGEHVQGGKGRDSGRRESRRRRHGRCRQGGGDAVLTLSRRGASRDAPEQGSPAVSRAPGFRVFKSEADCLGVRTRIVSHRWSPVFPVLQQDH